MAGVASEVLARHPVDGLQIDNHRTDLPVRKGLSSSAAICVLVARAFNQLYELGLTLEEEMDLAYRGEIATPSQCGRLDQACAYGRQPIGMTFDGSRIAVEPLRAPRALHLVIVDLNAAKDTRTILRDLNAAYPDAHSPLHKRVQEYLGPINRRIVGDAAAALCAGDAARLGALMREAQDAFDIYLRPACPAQLTAPILHEILDYAPIRPLVHGGKGVGSQGDGAAQLIARNAQCRSQVIEILEQRRGLRCLPLTLRPNAG